MPNTASASVSPFTCATPQSSRVMLTCEARSAHAFRVAAVAADATQQVATKRAKAWLKRVIATSLSIGLVFDLVCGLVQNAPSTQLRARCTSFEERNRCSRRRADLSVCCRRRLRERRGRRGDSAHRPALQPESQSG